MKIAVIGGGGVGGYLAEKLSEVADVDLISSSLEKLSIIENGQEQEFQVNIYKTPPKRAYDLVIFAVKSYVLRDAAKKIKSNLHKNTHILPLLNGIWPFEELKKLFPNNKVSKGAIYIISNKIAPNTIELKGKGALVVTDDVVAANVFQKAGIKVKIPEDIDRAIWQKYLFIAATAALTTYYDATFGEIATKHMEEFEAILDEIIAVANEKGIELNEDDKKRAIELLQKSPTNAKTSMQLDVKKGAPSEIENILGYLINQKTPKLKNIFHKLSHHDLH